MLALIEYRKPALRKWRQTSSHESCNIAITISWHRSQDWFEYQKVQKLSEKDPKLSIYHNCYIVAAFFFAFKKNIFLSNPQMSSNMISHMFYIFNSVFYSSCLKKSFCIFYQGCVRVILDLLVPYPKLHPYNGGFNLASGLLFMSCNTQLHKTTLFRHTKYMYKCKRKSKYLKGFCKLMH